MHNNFPFIALTLLIGRQVGHPTFKKSGVDFLVHGDDLTGALHGDVVTTGAYRHHLQHNPELRHSGTG